MHDMDCPASAIPPGAAFSEAAVMPLPSYPLNAPHTPPGILPVTLSTVADIRRNVKYIAANGRYSERQTPLVDPIETLR
jgi:hypothetical protein